MSGTKVSISDVLQDIIGDAGDVVSQYGGFKITVKHHARFAWYDVFSFLLGESFQIWVDRIEGYIVIVAKQKLD